MVTWAVNIASRLEILTVYFKIAAVFYHLMDPKNTPMGRFGPW